MATADYPNTLADPFPQRKAYPLRGRVLVVLVLACLALRSLMATRLTSIDPDGVLYVQLAKALEAGNTSAGTQGMGLNLYPAILVLVHRGGLDWETAGIVWGVGIASLVVLPLYGWVRRQFDDRVALAACALYAVHPTAIAWSPEITRDPTFWFLVTLTLYLLWRAVTEVRLRWFVAAGGSLVLAMLTRFEGLVLLIPFVLWTFWRLIGLKTARARLLLGAVLCVVAVPAAALAAACLWLRIPPYELPLRLDPWARFETWCNYILGGASTSRTGFNPLVPADATPMSPREMLPEFFPIMTRGLGPAYALLMFGGLWVWRRIWARRDHQALFYAAIGVLVGIWVHLWYERAICPRYALSIVLLASPFAALALLGLMRRAAQLAEWLGGGTRAMAAAAAVPVVLVAVIGVGAAMSGNQRPFALRKLAADLGRWAHDGPWRAPMIVGPIGMTSIVHYYTGRGRCESFRIDTADAPTIVRLVDSRRPDLLILRTTRRLDAAGCEELVARMKARGFSVVDPVPRPPGSDPVVVLVRDRGAARVASRAAR